MCSLNFLLLQYILKFFRLEVDKDKPVYIVHFYYYNSKASAYLQPHNYHYLIHRLLFLLLEQNFHFLEYIHCIEIKGISIEKLKCTNSLI